MDVQVTRMRPKAHRGGSVVPGSTQVTPATRAAKPDSLSTDTPSQATYSHQPPLPRHSHGPPPFENLHAHRRRRHDGARATARAWRRRMRASRRMGRWMRRTVRSAWCWRCRSLPADVTTALTQIQHELFDLGGELAVPGYRVITHAHIEQLENTLDRFNEPLPPLKEFILPGGGPAAAACHLARAITRRAERCSLGAGEAGSRSRRKSRVI